MIRAKSITSLTALAFLTLPLLAEPATAQSLLLYVAKNGSDAYACTSSVLPCLTIQGGVNRCPKVTDCQITIGTGIYPETVAVAHWMQTSFVGNCSDLTAVKIV